MNKVDQSAQISKNLQAITMDSRYDIIRTLIESGHIKSFRDIFHYIPKTVVYRDLRINFNRFSKAIINPARFTICELQMLAEFFKVDTRKMIDMAYEQSLAVKKKRRDKK